LRSTTIARTTPGPRGSLWSAATAIAGLPVAIAIAVPLTSFRAIAVAWATLAFGALGASGALGTFTATTWAAFGTFTTVARATSATGFGLVAARSIAALGIAITTTLFAGLTSGLAFFFVQLTVAIFVELFQHARHPS